HLQRRRAEVDPDLPGEHRGHLAPAASPLVAVGAKRRVGQLLTLVAELDLGAQRTELARHILVTALDVPRLADLGRPAATEGGDDQSGAGADVWHADVGAVESSWTADERITPICGDASTHPGQFGNVLEAVLIDRLGDNARAFRLCHECHVLGLQVGRKDGWRPGKQVDGPKRSRQVPPYADRAFTGLHLGSCNLSRTGGRSGWGPASSTTSPPAAATAIA